MADLVVAAGALEPGRAVGQVALVLLLADRQAEVGALVEAVDALAALGREKGDDVIALGKRADALPDPLDDPAPSCPSTVGA